MAEYYSQYWSSRIKDQERGNAFEEHRHFRLKWPKLSVCIPKDEHAIIVDFGCGDGKIIKEMLFLNPKARYIGLDVSDTALARASASLPTVEFCRIVDSGELPLPDSSVDFITCSEVIEHVYDTPNAFSEIARVLKPGGRLLLTTPYHGFIKNLLIMLFNFDNHFNPMGPHIRFFSKRSLFSCLAKFGLKCLRYGDFGRFYPIPHCIFVVAEKRD